MELILTKASVKDIKQIAGILDDATKRKLNYKDSAWGTTPWTDSELKEQLLSGYTYLVWINDKPIGSFQITYTQDNKWPNHSNDIVYLRKFAVINSYKNKNIGAEILNQINTLLFNQKIKYLRLDCALNNKNLCKYYEQQGFIKYGEHTNKDKSIICLYQKQIN